MVPFYDMTTIDRNKLREILRPVVVFTALFLIQAILHYVLVLTSAQSDKFTFLYWIIVFLVWSRRVSVAKRRRLDKCAHLIRIRPFMAKLKARIEGWTYDPSVLGLPMSTTFLHDDGRYLFTFAYAEGVVTVTVGVARTRILLRRISSIFSISYIAPDRNWYIANLCLGEVSFETIETALSGLEDILRETPAGRESLKSTKERCEAFRSWTFRPAMDEFIGELNVHDSEKGTLKVTKEPHGYTLKLLTPNIFTSIQVDGVNRPSQLTAHFDKAANVWSLVAIDFVTVPKKIIGDALDFMCAMMSGKTCTKRLFPDEVCS